MKNYHNNRFWFFGIRTVNRFFGIHIVKSEDFEPGIHVHINS